MDLIVNVILLLQILSFFMLTVFYGYIVYMACREKETLDIDIFSILILTLLKTSSFSLYIWSMLTTASVALSLSSMYGNYILGIITLIVDELLSLIFIFGFIQIRLAVRE